MGHVRISISKEKLAEFCRRRHIRKLSFFGSVLSDEFRPDSDVDVLVEFEPDYPVGFRIIEIEDIRTLQRNNYKKVQVVADKLDAVRFDLPGVTNLEQHDGSVRFFFKGDINAVLRRIGEMKVDDVSIEEPTLEEIFMHYYE